MSRKLIVTAAMIVTAVFSSACSTSATPTVESVFVATTTVPIAPDSQITLPPTWTMTPTPTNAPPTATVTPTPTSTVTPTLSAAAICDNFYITTNLRSGQYFAGDSQIAIYMNAVAPETTVRLLVVHHQSGQNRGADLPGGQANILQLPIRNLPQTGQYDWTLTVMSDTYGDICTQSGYFIATSRESTRAQEARIR